jgi:hypothetical protein
MSEGIPPLPNTPSWRGAQLHNKNPGTTLPFTSTREFLYTIYTHTCVCVCVCVCVCDVKTSYTERINDPQLW